jgi:D-glycero-alpha-D-manno-heptose-7-phosphate kinase
MLDLYSYTISKNSSIKEALVQIEKNHLGVVFLLDEYNTVIGLATDGDIRRHIVNNQDLSLSIAACANYDFIFAKEDTPRELLLKQLDNKIKIIPILDITGKLVSFITKDFIPQKEEKKVFSRAKSPVRISFGGGGSDISSYFIENRAAVINATISLYSHATLKIREDQRIYINSLDLNDSIEFNDINQLNAYSGKFSLIVSVIRAINPTYGFELFLYSDFPMSSGLGGSAVVTSSILGCFNQFRNDLWDKHDIAEIAFQSERLHMGIAGGWQDQYATVFGGVNFMEFNSDQNIITPIRLDSETIVELEESLLLCYTGVTHDSGNIHSDQKEQTKNVIVKDRIQSNVDLTFDMRNHLLRGRLNEFGKCIHKAWELKRGFSSKISNPWLDEIYNGAIQNGAIGGKLLGAGGGGYFLFYVPAFERNKLMNWVQSKGMVCTPFVFENQGLQSWKVRENQ